MTKSIHYFTFVVVLAMAFTIGAALVTAQPSQRNFGAHLDGELHDLNTKAQGQVIFKLNRDESEIVYRLIVANIENVLMAHIHLESATGPVVVWLYPRGGPPPELIPGRSDGVLATGGAITDASLVGPLEGNSLADLLAEMRSGNAFVNVHTSQNPGGEIAGKIR